MIKPKLMVFCKLQVVVETTLSEAKKVWKDKIKANRNKKDVAIYVLIKGKVLDAKALIPPETK